MAFQAHPGVIPLLLASTLLWANAGYLLWRGRDGGRAPGQLLAAGLVASFAVSVGAFALEQVHTGLGEKVVWNQLQYLGDAPLGAFLLAYVLVYVGYDLSWRSYAALFALPTVTVVAVFTNGFHSLFWRSVSLGDVAGYAVLDNGAGPLFYLYILYTYAFVVVALGVLVRAGVTGGDLHRRHLLALGVGTLLPGLAGIAYLLELGPTPTPNYPGYAYVLTAAAFTYSVHRHDVFAVMPVARRTVFEGMDDGVIVLDGRGVVVDANDAARAILGRAGESLSGRPGSEVLAPFAADGNGDEDGDRDGNEGIDPTRGDYRRRTVETDDGVFDVTARSLTRSGAAVGRLVTLRDVTERHRREQRLEEVTTRFQLALDGTDTGVWEWDIGTDDLYWDETSERLFGYEPGEFPGSYEDFVDRVHPDDRSPVERRIERAVEDDIDYEVEFRARVPDGDVHWIQSRGVVEYDDGEPVRMIGVQTDVTERKRFERSLEDRNRKLEVLNRIVRHDIRTDMDVVLGYASRLSETIDDDEVQDAIDVILESGDHVVELTEVVRDLMKTMDSETVTEPVNLGPVLRSELDAIRGRSEGVVVDAPDSPVDLWVVGDAMLGTVFRNILTNAVRHNDAERPEVSVSVDEAGDEVTVRVADNGPGVPDSRKEAIFGRGERGLESPGTGVGLYLVQQLVTGYGGDVWVEDRIGQHPGDDPEDDDGPDGAVFVVELPKAARTTPPQNATTG